MPVKKSTRKAKGGLGSKIKPAAKKAFKEQVKKPVSQDQGQQLPPGIENGVAKLTKCGFGIYKKGDGLIGEYFYGANAVVVEPLEHDDVKVAGMQFNKTEPVCDTPNWTTATQEEHLDNIQDSMKKLGADMSEASTDDLEEIAKDLQESDIYFRFRTWRGSPTQEYPNPKTREVWGQFIADYEPEDNENDDDVVDETEDEAEEEEVEDETEEEEETEEVDLAALTEQADSEGDDATEAGEQITKIALAAGIKEAFINKAESWAAVVEAIPSEDEAEEEEDEEEELELTEDEEEFVPSKSDVYLYKPKGKRKAVECEVTAVIKTKKVCNLKNLDDNSVYKSVPWDQLDV